MTLDNFPTTRPSITLDFTKSKKLDPRITFSRASNAGTTPPTTGEGTGDVNGQVYEFQENVPRLTDQGLLIEEARTNLAVGTINMKSDWERTINSNLMATITNNAAIGPDGTMSANLITPEYNDGASFVDVVQDDQNPYSVSCYLKDNGAGEMRLYYQSIFNAYCDLTTGEVTDEFGNPQPPLVDVGNGWWYFQKSVSAGFGNPGQTRYLWVSLIDYSADSVKGFYVYGMQFEQGSFSTSWIGTPVGGTATRAVDLITITGGVDQWFNANEGAWVFDVDVFGSSDDYPRLLQSNQSHLWEYQTFNSAPTAKAFLFSGWLTGQTTKTPFGIAPTGEFKIAANYSIGNKSPIYIDGTEQVRGDSTYTPGTGPVTFPTEFRIFRQNNGGQFLSGYVKSLVYYSTSVSDDSLKALTTQQT